MQNTIKVTSKYYKKCRNQARKNMETWLYPNHWLTFLHSSAKVQSLTDFQIQRKKNSINIF